MNMWASVQKCKEAKKAKRVVKRKQDKHINIARSGERCKSSTPAPRRCISQVVTSKQRCDHTSTSLQRAQSMAKPISREVNMEIEHRNRQANIDMQRKLSKPFNIGLDVWM